LDGNPTFGFKFTGIVYEFKLNLDMKKTYIILLFLLVSLPFISLGKLLPGQSVFHFQTDKQLYVSGEKIRFKNTLVSAENNDHQTILFVDLCGEGAIVSSRIIERENNHWSADITIPDSLETGVYLLRAYTGNYDGKPQLVTKPVTVINRFGNNNTNEQRKTVPGYKVFDQIHFQPKKSGKGLNVYASENHFGTSQNIELWIENENIKSSSGISLLVSKVYESDNKNNIDPDVFQINTMGHGNDKIYNRLTLSGKLKDTDTGKPVLGETMLFSIPDSVPLLYYAKTDENGFFQIILDNYYGEKDVIVQSLNKSFNYNIDILSNLLPPPDSIPYYISEEIEFGEAAKMATNRSMIHKAYLKEEVKGKDKITYKYPFYGKTTNIVETDTYFELDDFDEITREILPLCRIRKEDGIASMRIYDPNNLGVHNKPWILVDGVPVFDITPLLPLGTATIKKVETQSQTRCYGGLLIEGAISVQTRNVNFRDVPLPKNAVRLRFDTFYTPSTLGNDQLTGLKSFADFRDVLYWNPVLAPFTSVTKVGITSSLEKGKYAATVEATDNSGNVTRDVFFFTVD
jgi:hypothetical protein